nr:Chain C, PEPTIDE2 [Escherichia coli BL21]
AAAASAA